MELFSTHPNPQFARPDTLLLDGEWEFEVDNAAQYWKAPKEQKDALKGTIRVPFAPESELSGIGDREMNFRLWYAKNLTLPESFRGRNVLLHFGAVDYRARVFVNGRFAFEHFGGYTPFSVDITEYLNGEGTERIVLCAADNTRDPKIPSGKQSPLYKSFSALYTRTSGIWQSVWLEACGDTHLDGIRFLTRTGGEVGAQVAFSKSAVGCDLTFDVSYRGAPVLSFTERVTAFDHAAHFTVPEPNLWGAGEGNLYDCRLTLTRDGAVLDTVDTYFGIREVGFDGPAFVLNGKPLFLRTVLDQGFYPDGIYTAPSDEALEGDVLLAMAMGFNGARLHEKVFDPRYLYHADRHGFLVFGEYPDMGLSTNSIEAVAYMLPEWLEAMKRDVNHPAIVAWCPFNETSTNDFITDEMQDNRVIETVYHITKQFDPSRPVFDTSGSMHTSVTDVYDVHDYTQSEEKFVARYENGYYHMYGDVNGARRDQPYMVTEFGGILWDVDGGGSSWGYGAAPKTEEEFLTRFEMMTRTLLGNPVCTGFCYTQLYDVEQEKNGLHTYARVPKFDVGRIRRAVAAKAAIEG